MHDFIAGDARNGGNLGASSPGATFRPFFLDPNARISPIRESTRVPFPSTAHGMVTPPSSRLPGWVSFGIPASLAQRSSAPLFAIALLASGESFAALASP